jgi:hypothetical protein
MNRPGEIADSILDMLDITDASRRERYRLAKLVYKVQVTAFTEALSDYPEDVRRKRWYETSRKYKLHGSQ